MINVIKSTGIKEPFNPEKIKATCQRIGASPKMIEKIVQSIIPKLYDNITTGEIYKLVFEALKEEGHEFASRYSLREALFRLGPAGFNFEHYIAKVLNAYGYKTEMPDLLRGASIQHEVDIIAEKENRRFMVECKWRNSLDKIIIAKDVLATWARFLDLVEGAELKFCPHFDEPWIITNSIFSNDALTYGQYKNISMLSWNYPPQRPLPVWIDAKGLYPITVLFNLSSELLPSFVEADILLVRDLATLSADQIKKLTHLPEDQLRIIINEAKEVYKITNNYRDFSA